MEKTVLEKRDIRKLQLIGGSTYLVSLPKKWITQMVLEKGSRVALVEQIDGSLLITPETLNPITSPVDAIIMVEEFEDPDLITRKIASTYIAGYNIIYIRTKNGRLNFLQRNVLKDFTRKKLVGTEILADSPNEIILKVLLSYPELSVESALRRMCSITFSLHKEAIEAVSKLDADLAHEVIELDDEVDRFKIYIHRQLWAAIKDPNVLNEIGLPSRTACLGHRLMIQIIERIADYAVEIAENTFTLKQPLEAELAKRIESMSALAMSMFTEIMEAMFRRNFHQANKTIQQVQQIALLRKEVMKSILQRTAIEEVSSLSLIIESINKAANDAKDIAEAVLNGNVEQAITHQ